MTQPAYGDYSGRNAQPTDDMLLPGQNDAAHGSAQLTAALADQRERTGYAPGEGPAKIDDRQRYGSLSSLDKLKREAEKDITNFKEIPVPGDYRAGWSFIVDCLISGDQMERYTNQSKRKSGRGRGDDDINVTELNCRVLLNHVTEIRENGEPLLDDNGRPIRLSSREFIDAMGKNKGIDALRHFVWDSHIGIMVDRVMDAAGYSRDGDNWVEAAPVDPMHG